MENVAPGRPSWVDLGTPDLDASRHFYSQLFGWEADVSDDPQFGGYTTFRKDGKAVAGAGGLSSEGQAPAWSTYLATDNAEAVAAKVEENGGRVLAAPMDVGDEGRMAVFADPAGAAFAVWQAGNNRGAQLINATGALSWNELITHDPAGARRFYGAVFGWEAKETPDGDARYTLWRLGGEPVGGMMRLTAAPDLPPLWMVYFAVEDCDATAERAAQLGGRVAVAPTNNVQGRFAMLNDPQGAVFSIIQAG
ncbi:MAG: VOC family protein [Micromonosporaceae bacterium]|nr:VOC family protein [Micromonosporaceae bacterium]